MDENQTMVKIENVTKTYRLGQIGGTTLKDEIARLKAKLFKKEDPTKKIGAKNYNKGEKFNALTDVSFEVKKGEAIGLIGHNGAGKSTLLKLITRVTAPTKGKICLNGRVASMLEVGTGFHGELTGRENVYMNGAILGMTKKEIDAKMEDIIEFSEVRQFIDTPVKRYSSGMYVKLAFSVAAHLDSEILLMDEVLAVGDMAFQMKCINKMKEIANSGRTIIYVSHSMNTIRQLCNRCVVLNKGQVIYQGDVEQAIRIYTGMHSISTNRIDLTNFKRNEYEKNDLINFSFFEVDGHEKGLFSVGEKMTGFFNINNRDVDKKISFRIIVKTNEGIPVTMANVSESTLIKAGENKISFILDISHIVPGEYNLNLLAYESDNITSVGINIDVIHKMYYFQIVGDLDYNNSMEWKTQYWGYFNCGNLLLKREENYKG